MGKSGTTDPAGLTSLRQQNSHQFSLPLVLPPISGLFSNLKKSPSPHFQSPCASSQGKVSQYWKLDSAKSPAKLPYHIPNRPIPVRQRRGARSVQVTDKGSLTYWGASIIVRLLRGVGRLRPPLPRYQTTWDVSQVLTYLETLGSAQDLNLKNLTLKLRNKCYITKCLKTSRPNVAQPCLIIPRKLDRTKTKRNCNQFFVSFTSPFKPVSTQTISRWLVLVLKQSGIDISVYKGHSYRHAATSKAHSVGVNTDCIYRSAGWSTKSKMFAKFYNRPLSNDSNFANAILENKLS
ncbi:hypothetical protein Ocin01_13420 [Orchesella cincta]|uniref:Tyr recombinase domain-containing protein n=1 Tax=Orchesella cincta TaxID=48709 RepID=A0A1D2MJV1_ORCCI|nr:hypothetical protein Ocin01_13420 [Orchesella cincta]